MAILRNMNSPIVHGKATIDSGAAVSSLISLNELGPRGLAVLIPAAWTAANIGFEVTQLRTGPFIPLYDKLGVRAVITGIATAESRLYVAPAEGWFIGVWKFLRLASLDTADGTAENQGAARELRVIFVS